jgi:hypothetical protein
MRQRSKSVSMATDWWADADRRRHAMHNPDLWVVLAVAALFWFALMIVWRGGMELWEIARGRR